MQMQSNRFLIEISFNGALNLEISIWNDFDYESTVTKPLWLPRSLVDAVTDHPLTDRVWSSLILEKKNIFRFTWTYPPTSRLFLCRHRPQFRPRPHKLKRIISVTANWRIVTFKFLYFKSFVWTDPSNAKCELSYRGVHCAELRRCCHLLPKSAFVTHPTSGG